MNFNTILFDLDGTITDPALGITNSVIYALKKFNIAPPPREELYKFIGPPLANSFEKYYNLTTEDSYKAVDYYREYFAPKGLFENKVYQGVQKMLSDLKNQGKRIILATSKPKIFADKILEHFDLAKYFEFTVGSNLDGTLTDKGEVIAKVLELANISDTSSVAMVGDREHDVIGAIKNNVYPIGVTYGYGSRDELLTAGAKKIADSPNELCSILL